MTRKELIKELLEYLKTTPRRPNFAKIQVYMQKISETELNEIQIDVFMECILKYIDLVINLSAKKGFREQIKICREHFSILPDVICEVNFLKAFVRKVTQKLFDTLIEEDVNTWCVKRELLKIFLACIQNIPKNIKHGLVDQLPDFYLFKLVDLISTYGDYEFQVTLIEAVFRMYGRSVIVPKLKDIIPESQELSQSFADIKGDTFDEDSRRFLNALNENSGKVFSIVCNSVFLGSTKCLEPIAGLDGLWVDFNLSENAVSWYCARDSFPSEKQEDSESVWNLLMFFATDVDFVKIHRMAVKKEAIVYIKLRTPCISTYEGELEGIKRAEDVKFLVSLNSPKTTALISKVLPNMFGHKFERNTPKLSFSKRKPYKPLSISVYRKTKSESSRTKSDTSSYLNPFEPINVKSDVSSTRNSSFEKVRSVSSSSTKYEVISISDSSAESSVGLISKAEKKPAETQYETAEMCPVAPVHETLITKDGEPDFHSAELSDDSSFTRDMNNSQEHIRILAGRCSGSKSRHSLTLTPTQKVSKRSLTVSPTQNVSKIGREKPVPIMCSASKPTTYQNGSDSDCFETANEIVQETEVGSCLESAESGNVKISVNKFKKQADSPRGENKSDPSLLKELTHPGVLQHTRKVSQSRNREEPQRKCSKYFKEPSNTKEESGGGETKVFGSQSKKEGKKRFDTKANASKSNQRALNGEEELDYTEQSEKENMPQQTRKISSNKAKNDKIRDDSIKETMSVNERRPLDELFLEDVLEHPKKNNEDKVRLRNSPNNVMSQEEDKENLEKSVSTKEPEDIVASLDAEEKSVSPKEPEDIVAVMDAEGKSVSAKESEDIIIFMDPEEKSVSPKRPEDIIASVDAEEKPVSPKEPEDIIAVMDSEEKSVSRKESEDIAFVDAEYVQLSDVLAIDSGDKLELEATKSKPNEVNLDKKDAGEKIEKEILQHVDDFVVISSQEYEPAVSDINVQEAAESEVIGEFTKECVVVLQRYTEKKVVDDNCSQGSYIGFKKNKFVRRLSLTSSEDDMEGNQDFDNDERHQVSPTKTVDEREEHLEEECVAVKDQDRRPHQEETRPQKQTESVTVGLSQNCVVLLTKDFGEKKDRDLQRSSVKATKGRKKNNEDAIPVQKSHEVDQIVGRKILRNQNNFNEIITLNDDQTKAPKAIPSVDPVQKKFNLQPRHVGLEEIGETSSGETTDSDLAKKRLNAVTPEEDFGEVGDIGLQEEGRSKVDASKCLEEDEIAGDEPNEVISALEEEENALTAVEKDFNRIDVANKDILQAGDSSMLRKIQLEEKIKENTHQVEDEGNRTIFNHSLSTTLGGRKRRKLYNSNDLSHMESILVVEKPSAKQEEPSKVEENVENNKNITPGKIKPPTLPVKKRVYRNKQAHVNVTLKPVATKNKQEKSNHLKTYKTHPKATLDVNHNHNLSHLHSAFYEELESFRKDVKTSFTDIIKMNIDNSSIEDKKKADKSRKRNNKRNVTKTVRRTSARHRNTLLADRGVRAYSESTVSEASVKLKGKVGGGHQEPVPLPSSVEDDLLPNRKKINVISDIQIRPKRTLLETDSAVPVKRMKTTHENDGDVERDIPVASENITQKEISQWINTGSPNYLQTNSERVHILKHSYYMFVSVLGQPDESEEYHDVLTLCKITKKYV